MKTSLLLIFTAVMWPVLAQKERALTRDGNKLFDKGKYADAEAQYKKALEQKNNFPEAAFNLGDAMYKQQRYDEAAKQFELSSKLLNDPQRKAQSFHNLGNCHLEKQAWENAVTAYKQALKLNAQDRDTKYNLAYANAKLKQQQQNKNDQNHQQNKQQQQNKKDQQQDKQDNKNQDQQDKKEGDDKEQQQQPPRQRKGALSKEQAEKLLEALKNEEQKAQEKVQKKTAKPVEVKVEKDW